MDELDVLQEMQKDITSDFSELKRPSTFVGAVLRFLVVILAATALFFATPNSWDEWKIGLSVGLVAGIFWAISWRWKGIENRLIVWLVFYLGGMALWCKLYPVNSALGMIAYMYVGLEAAMLILHYPLQRWIQNQRPSKEVAEQAASSNH